MERCGCGGWQGGLWSSAVPCDHTKQGFARKWTRGERRPSICVGRRSEAMKYSEASECGRLWKHKHEARHTRTCIYSQNPSLCLSTSLIYIHIYTKQASFSPNNFVIQSLLISLPGHLPQSFSLSVYPPLFLSLSLLPTPLLSSVFPSSQASLSLCVVLWLCWAVLYCVEWVDMMKTAV